MNADERIEKLLNHFGQTISDLPKPDNTVYAYEVKDIEKAYDTSFKWHNERVIRHGILLHSGDYICHLANVIDRMEVALETALSCCYCEYCAHNTKEDDGVACDDCVYDGESRFRIKDEEFTEYDEWLLTNRSEDEHDHPAEG